ncbi:hypothetical protein [Arthrobacter sp. AD-310]
MLKSLTSTASHDAVGCNGPQNPHGSRTHNAAWARECTTGFISEVEKISTLPNLPMNAEQAEVLMDTDGNVTVTVVLDKEIYLRYVVSSTTGEGATPEDYAHGAAFKFGRPRESAAEIIGVSGSDFIVSYSTHVREYLDD